jgi:hypothetical protein
MNVGVGKFTPRTFSADGAKMLIIIQKPHSNAATANLSGNSSEISQEKKLTGIHSTYQSISNSAYRCQSLITHPALTSAKSCKNPSPIAHHPLIASRSTVEILNNEKYIFCGSST